MTDQSRQIGKGFSATDSVHGAMKSYLQEFERLVSTNATYCGEEVSGSFSITDDGFSTLAGSKPRATFNVQARPYNFFRFPDKTPRDKNLFTSGDVNFQIHRDGLFGFFTYSSLADLVQKHFADSAYSMARLESSSRHIQEEYIERNGIGSLEGSCLGKSGKDFQIKLVGQKVREEMLRYEAEHPTRGLSYVNALVADKSKGKFVAVFGQHYGKEEILFIDKIFGEGMEPARALLFLEDFERAYYNSADEAMAALDKEAHQK